MDGSEKQRSGSSSSRSTAASGREGFSSAKPLPPIGTPRERSGSDADSASRDDDKSSITASRASSRMSDHPGDGAARPRIVRGFRPEIMSGDEVQYDRPKLGVTFSPSKERAGLRWKVNMDSKYGSGPKILQARRRPYIYDSKSPASVEMERRLTYDGREVDFVTLDTQTDWDWVAEFSGIPSARDDVISAVQDEPGTGAHSKAESREGKESSHFDEKTVTDTTPFAQPYIDDEYGIPLMELSSDTDTDDEDSAKKHRDDRNFIPSIGPPQILQYIRESERKEKDEELEVSESLEMMVDELGRPIGMFGGICEFCQNLIKPFPTLDMQLTQPPEELYCCDDYRNFIEESLKTAMEIEEMEREKNKMIDINVHPHHGTKQARAAAKEKAAQKMRERELQRRQQEASSLQGQASFLPSASAGKTKGGAGISMKDMYGSRKTPSGFRKTPHPLSDYQSAFCKDPLPPITDNPWDAAPCIHLRKAPGTPKGPEVARQIKTINYSLSSQRCLEEGWTLRAPSPLFDDHDMDVYVPEPLHPDVIASGKFRERPIVQKFYDNGHKFLTIFPDGTGNVFYPSGNLAILISSPKLGQYSYTLHDDIARGAVIAAFDPSGFGYCYFPNGIVRLYIDQFGGLELDSFGGKRRRWQWKDQITHVHAPPFQPICIGLNRNIGVRVMSQENIIVSFSARKRGCRFNMGAKLKLIAPEKAPPREIDDDYIFLEDKKAHMDALLDKVSTLLKFPKSPKIDKILPPLHVTAKIQRTEKLKKEQKRLLAVNSARDKKSATSVSVN